MTKTGKEFSWLDLNATRVIATVIGVFFGLLATGMAFSVIMTGVGVISLAGAGRPAGALLREQTQGRLGPLAEEFERVLRLV